MKLFILNNILYQCIHKYNIVSNIYSLHLKNVFPFIKNVGFVLFAKYIKIVFLNYQKTIRIVYYNL